MVFGLYSPDGTYDETFLTNYMNINVKPGIQRISGVGEVNVMGGAYAMRIWLKPDVMAQYELVPADVTAALSSQNIEASTGAIGEDSENVFQYTLKYRGRLEEESQFEEIIIKAFDDGRVLRLKDIADVELGAQSYSFKGYVNGLPGATCMINQISGSNANEIIINIEDYLKQVEKDLPDGIELVQLMSTKTFLDASINKVIETLLEAIILVVLVVYVFLQNPRSTLIPTISIFVSLIGTFAVLYLAGFSINLLTLFALVLAIGTIVDDAIIVVEAVQTKFDEGYSSPYRAAVDAMGGVSSALVTSTLVFMAVFVPVAFMGGTAGVFYTQFGITMAVAVGISAVNALTLSPALCALILRPNQQLKDGEKPEFSTRFRMAFDSTFRRIVAKYVGGVFFIIKHKWLGWSLLGVACALLLWLMGTAKSGLVPNEDTGAMFMSFDSPAGSTLSETKAIMQEIQAEVKQIPQIANFNMVAGFGMSSGNGASHGMFIIKLKPWDERTGKNDNVDAIRDEIYRRTAHIKNARLFIFAPPMIQGYGSGNSFDVYIQDRAGKGYDELSRVTTDFLEALNKRVEIERAQTSFNANFPQYTIDVDEAQCQRAGTTTSEVLSVLSGYFGSIYASNFNRFTKIYRVIVQAPYNYRDGMEALNNIYVRTKDGMAPISQFVTLTKSYGAESLMRFNMFSAINVQGMPAAGYSSGDVINAINEVAAQTLPTGYGFEFSGMTREEVQTSN